MKRAVDDDPRPGRFILTGNVRSDLETKMWPGTGRLMRVQMYGLTQREIVGGSALAGPSMLDKIAMRSAAAFSLPDVRPDLRDYITLATRGGFPAAFLGTPPGYIEMWVASYLDQLLTRDAHPIVANRDQQKLAAYFRALAWSVDHLDRLIRTAKRYVVDSSLMVASLGADIDTILGSSDLLGRMIDTFAMAQLRPEVAAARQRIRLYHARTKGGREEVDIVAELPGGKLIGIEIKASSAPRYSDAKHLCWLRAQIPRRFVAGVVLHSGPDVIQLDDDIHAVPIACPCYALLANILTGSWLNNCQKTVRWHDTICAC